MGQANIARDEIQVSEGNSLPLLIGAAEVLDLEAWAASERSVGVRNSFRWEDKRRRTNMNRRAVPDPLLRLLVIQRPLRQPLYPPTGLTDTIEEISRKLRIEPPQPEVLMQTPVSETDLLLIAKSKIRNKFLTKEEKMRLKLPGAEGVENFLKVMIMSSGAWGSVNLKWWDSVSNYAVIGNEEVFRNKITLKLGTVIQLWFFRFGTKLCFALVEDQHFPAPA